MTTILTVDPEALVPSYTNSDQNAAAVTALADGGYIIVWQSALQDAGTKLGTAMFWCILGGSVMVVALLWIGPETRGRELR